MIYMFQVEKRLVVQPKTTGSEWTWIQILALSPMTVNFNFQMLKLCLC